MQKPVAILAHSFRFPGTTQENFWNDLLANKNLITTVEKSRWEQAAFFHPDRRHPGTSYTFSAGSIGDISGFDAAFFGISPREAALMDPQQRLLLELAWETFENAGILPSSVRGTDCGVFIGLSSVDYAYRMADDLAAFEASSATGMVSCIAANRISYFFDFHGPSMTLDTACSSSLVALHQACQAIRLGEISTALAGGINLHLHPYGFISFSKASMLSKTGQCHVFDASGDGYVRSEGGGLVLLKDYQQALADGDLILAVIAGSGINTDGSKSGLTIPNPQAQARLISDVYTKAGIHPDSIDYFEAHGTGTPVGDPIETQAIGLALGQKRESPLLIGSIKSNLGHLESASGIAGLIKALYCLKHRVVPATIGIEKSNPHIKFTEWNLEAVTKNQPLSKKGKLTIGINSFGFGGANAHLIIQNHIKTPAEAHQVISDTSQTSDLPLILSGKDDEALQQVSRNLANYILANNSLCFYDLCYTAFFHREHHTKLAVLFAKNSKEAFAKLQEFNGENPAEQLQTAFKQPNIFIGDSLSVAHGPAWVFAGNGCQWQGMGKILLEKSVLFRQTIIEIDHYFSRYADYSLLDDLSGKLGVDRYQKTEFAQPALFALQVGLCQVLRALGVRPVAVAGHSVGEVAAAWAAGALSLSDAVKVIYYRSFYQGQTQGLGQMTAVGLGAEAMQKRLDDLAFKQVYIAGINSPRGVTVAGDSVELAQLEAILKQEQVFYKRLDLDYPFHTPAMDTIEAGIRSSLGGVQPRNAEIAYYSTVTGNVLPGEKLDGHYWWCNIRQPVKFEQSIDAILNTGVNTFIEIGAHPVLKSYLQDCLKARSLEGKVIPTFKRNHGDIYALYNSLAQTLISGCFNPTKSQHKTNHWFSHKGNLVQLPNYAWQREKFWHPITTESYGLLTRHKVHPLLGYALKQQERQWENQLDTQLYPYLNDHNIGGAVLFPGAGFAEVALAMALQSQAGDCLEIEELEIRSPLVLSHEHCKVFRSSLEYDGRFTLSSRDHANANATEWTKHCTGRVISASSGSVLALDQLAIPTRPSDFDRISHNQLTASVSLNYGLAFQTINFGWIEEDSAIGVLEAPEQIHDDLDAYLLHPAFLDGAFQLVFQILKNEIINHDDIALVPVKMGKILVHRAKITPRFAKAVIKSRSSHSLNTDIELFDADTCCIARIHSVRFRAVRLHRQATQKPSYLDYHLIASPLKHINSEIEFNPGLITSCLKDEDLTIKADRYSQELEPLLDSLCHYTLIEGLTSLVDETGFLPNALLNTYVELNPGLSQYLLSELAIAIEDKIFVEQAEGWQINIEIAQQQLPTQVIWTSLAQDYPEYFYLILLAGRLGLHLPKIISNHSSAQSLVFTADQYTNITNLIFRQTCKTAITRVLTTQLEQIVAKQQVGERLKLLEISCHQPEFAGLLLPKLNLSQSDYLFGCVSETAINNAKQLREHFPLLKAIDLQENEENITVEDQDKANIAVIFLNFGNISTVQKIISLLPRLVVQNSPIIFIGLYPARWIDHVLGVSKDWWISSEEEHFSPQLSPDQLLRQLVTQNFTDNIIQNCGTGDLSGIYLINTRTPITQKPLITEKQAQNWLILCGSEMPERTLANQLSNHLLAQGQIVTLSEDRWRITENIDTFQHIINLSGFAQSDMAIQLQRCDQTVQIIKATETATNKPTIWVLTHNVSSLYARDQEHAFSPAKNQIAHDSAIWGFGRSLMNETIEGSIRLLDIAGDSLNVDAKTVVAICEELLANNKEQEVFLTQAGIRFVPRLRSRSELIPSTLENTLQSHLTLQLGFSIPGQLKNLQWQSLPLPSLSPDDIEIDVHATGLNFRDIMYTLGLLPDEAVENGFVGSTLGLEFAGIVKKIGSNITGFKTGDRVVGMGPASFSNVVRTKANAIAIIPNGLDFLSAATIPSTFFTAYYALHHQANLQPGEKVLIHGAAGGIGIAAIQIARWLGAEIFASVGSDEKRDFLKLLGIKHIYDSRSLSFSDEILINTNHQGVDVVLNSLAGEAIDRNFKVLKPFGRFLELGKRDFYENTQIGLRPFRNNISYFGIDADQLLKERPELTQKLFLEMMTLFTSGVLYPLPYTVFDANHSVEAFRYMQQAKQIGKVVISYENGINYLSTPNQGLKKSLTLSSSATYLVTGGLGGFGLKTAQWLVEKGARHLCLISRSGAVSEEAQSAISQFASQGVEVLASACDITDKNALKVLLDACEKNLPVIKGIVHAAAVFEDGFANQTDKGRIQRVLDPKMYGALHLHELTQKLPIDFFVLYSSITTLFGNPGQSNYVAANLWLEALAVFRHQHKLPVTCICLGAIDDVGFLARHEKIKEVLKNRMGGSVLNSYTALSALEQMLLTKAPTLGFSYFDWRVLSQYLPASRSPKFDELTLNTSKHESDDNHHFDIASLLELSDEELKEKIIELLKEELSLILLIAKDRIDANQSIYDMGMDSLMGVELIIAIENRFSVQIPVMALGETATLSKLADRLIINLRNENLSSENDITRHVKQLAIQHDSEISEKQVDSFIANMDTNRVHKSIIPKSY